MKKYTKRSRKLKRSKSKNRNVKRVRSKIIKKSYLPVELGVGLVTFEFILAGAGGYYLYNKNGGRSRHSYRNFGP